jgi:hypothetical protein
MLCYTELFGIFNPLNGSLIPADWLKHHTSFISLSWASPPNFDTSHYTMSKSSQSLILPLTLSENGLKY